MPEAPEATRERSRVLVVDDDEAVVRMLRDILSREYEVVGTTSAQEALELLRGKRFDAVVADHMMPGMTGLELLQRAIALCPATARVMITASDRVEDARDAVNTARVARFLTKPVRVLEVIETVQGAIKEQGLEGERQSLLDQIKERDALLERALSELRTQEQRLENEVAIRTSELRKAVAQLEQLAMRDGLTGLYNHRFFHDILNGEIARAARYSRILSLAFLDVDLFKAYNDANGRPLGDDLLKDLARILTNTGQEPELAARGRESDVPARFGGEEFVIILPETPKSGAVVRAERLRASVEAYPFPRRDCMPDGKVTISVGIATYPNDAMTKQALVEAADRALLEAKRKGRNRVVAAGLPAP